MPIRKEVKEWVERQNKRKEGGFVGVAASAPFLDIPRFSSGSLDLDVALGGGWPRRRMSLIYGPESSGKTTICIRACASVQCHCMVCWKHQTECECKKFQRGTAMWVDAEGTFDRAWGIAHGFDPEDHVLVRPRYGEEAMDLIRDGIESRIFDLIILDSIEAAIPAAEREKSMEDAMVGDHAKLMNRAYRVWNAEMMDAGKMAPTLIAINQCREQIGKMYGDTVVLPGGKGQRFFSSVHIRLTSSKVHDIKDGTQHAYVEVGGSVPRNKTAVPRLDFNFNIALQDYEEYTKGEIFNTETIIRYGRQFGFVKTGGGNWWVEIDGNLLTDKVKGREGLTVEIRKQGEALYRILREETLKHAVPR